jgi:LacI family transcriptional regulator
MSGRFVTETGYEAARALLDAPEPPTAIFAGNDLQALGVYRALYEAGLRTPDDMSVVGFDDLPIAGLLTPALTTVRQPVREMGALATRMLLRLIAGERLESTRVELATSLIVRESSAPPRS